MYVNAKMIPVETVAGIRGGEVKEISEGMNSSMIYLIYFKNLCKCNNVPTLNTTLKNKKKMKFNIPSK
jgi:hypothetical protein